MADDHPSLKNTHASQSTACILLIETRKWLTQESDLYMTRGEQTVVYDWIDHMNQDQC